MKRLLLISLFIPMLSVAQFDLNLEQIANGYTRPCEIVNAGDERLFLLEQNGRIRILYTDGEQVSTPFLDIANNVASIGEQGLLGLAFPSDYCFNGKFYVNYTFNENNQLYTRISSFLVNPENENDALEESEEVLLEFEQDFGNHNGGQLEFGPDGMLYIFTGDGGSGGDPNNRAQDITSYLGKILRIDVSTVPYSIPPDNPFAFDDFGLDEIWAYGLRNPWKSAFDEVTGDLYIADVGQSNREEVNYYPAGAEGGANFGWRCYEGTAPFNLSQCDAEYIDPVFDYAYGNQGNGFRCSVTGGRVYNGNSFPSLQGKYIFTDYCSSEYWVLWQENGEWEVFTDDNLGNSVTAFGADVWGELYVLNATSSGSVNSLIEGEGPVNPQIQISGSNTLETTLSGSSYQWFLNGEAIPDANQETLEIDEVGIYTLLITSANGCEIETRGLEITALSLADNDRVRSLNLFPNPARDRLSVQYDLIAGNQDVFLEIFNLQGQSLYMMNNGRSENAEIDLSDISSGVYFLRMRNAEGSVLANRKLVIE